MSSSHELPARANLEHLRNEAKQRLRELRARDDAARLSDAQLLVARAYGFPSWRRWDCNNTALHITTELTGGAIELTRMLLDAGADPNIRDDKYQATVLGWAEYCGQPRIAELLRQRGATT